jgi:hypothetical protein
MSDEAIGKQQEILIALENVFEQEEMFWLQRGRVNWIRHGDRNTNFFRRYTLERKKRNLIKSCK